MGWFSITDLTYKMSLGTLITILKPERNLINGEEHIINDQYEL
jgi:hypothetical protein